MTDFNIHTREGLPTELHTLLRAHPRDSWPDHPNFARSIQNWMGAHQGFRRLGALLQTETEALISKQIDDERFARQLSRYGNILVNNLHGHHTWEDRSFFPELTEADPRFENGINMLESDHNVLDETLERFTHQGNRILKLFDLDKQQAMEEARIFRDTTQEIAGFLPRHLADEEDLVVPILLHHELRR